MTRFSKPLILLAVVLALVCSLSAQTILTPTTLSAAIPDGKVQTMVVASATPNASTPANFAVGSFAYINKELIQIKSVSGTTMGIIRGIGGSTAAPHASGELVFSGASNNFFSKPGFLNPQGSCTRSNELTLPMINVATGVISDCLGGKWVQGVKNDLQPFRVPFPTTGGTAYTSLNTNGTTAGNTTLYCTEINLPANRLITGIALLNGTTVGTDKRYVVLYDASGKLLANSALAGVLTATASVYQAHALTSVYYAVGPAQYFGCFQTDTGTDTTRMAVTGTNDNLLTKGQTSAVFGTVPALTVPTTFTTAVGPYLYVY